MEQKSNRVIVNEVRDDNLKEIFRNNLPEQERLKEQILRDGNELEMEPPKAIKAESRQTKELQKDSLS
jgi:hypothetical protein